MMRYGRMTGGLQYNKNVRLGENAWTGAGAITVPTERKVSSPSQPYATRPGSGETQLPDAEAEAIKSCFRKGEVQHENNL